MAMVAAAALLAGIASAAPSLARQARPYVAADGPVGRVLDTVARVDLFGRRSTPPADAGAVTVRLPHDPAPAEVARGRPIVGLPPMVAFPDSTLAGTRSTFNDGLEPTRVELLNPVGGIAIDYYNPPIVEGPAIVPIGSSGAGGTTPLALGRSGRTSQVIAVAPVPEPETYVLMLAGLGMVAVAVRVKWRKC